MSWFGWGSTSAPPTSSDHDSSSAEAKVWDQTHYATSSDHPTVVQGGESSLFGLAAQEPHQTSTADTSMNPAPVFALEQLKHSGLQLGTQMTPYLQMDPSMFRSAQPQYIMPSGEGGAATGKGSFEFAMGHIGWAVGGGFFAGSLRGFVPELMNRETRQLTGKPWMTRMVNATVKHGSGFAQPAGAIVFLYSVTEIGLRNLRADDEINSFVAGTLTGLLYRAPHGLRAMGLGGAVGLAVSTLWIMANSDKRQRLMDML